MFACREHDVDASLTLVRSEGGAECRKVQKEMRPPGEEDAPLGVALKQDPDDKWSSGGIMV